VVRILFFVAGLAAALLVANLYSTTAAAAVVATIDRDQIELNESFTLKVTVDTAIDREPDASALDDDFEILTRSELSNTTIVNGQISRSRTWTYILMAKQEGELEVPPVIVGRERSEPLSIRVTPQRVAVPGEADIFVDAEVDYPETFVQAQVIYRLKVYRAVATRQPRLSEPDISGVDVLVEAAAEERSYESLINGKSYTVNERVYALFPQASGQINISPARFEARVLADGRITGRKVFQSEAVTIDVKPIPPPPAEHPDAAWFPAKSVELSESWSREPDALQAGEPITRHVTVTALGQLSTQIPVMEPVASDAVKIYPDKPELRVAPAAGGLLASRKDQYAIIGVTEGDVQLPAVELPWWDIAEGVWRVARLPATTIRILASTDAVAEPAPAQQAAREPAEIPGTVVVHSNFWRHVSEVLAALWLLTLVAWWFGRRRPVSRQTLQMEDKPVLRQQSALVKAARKAAAKGDASGARSALLEWARLQWPKHAPRSIGEIAARVSEPLASELMALNRVSYGPAGANWDGTALGSELRSIRIDERFREESGETAPGGTLPPLMPQV
jgi:hypothetical protein